MYILVSAKNCSVQSCVPSVTKMEKRNVLYNVGIKADKSFDIFSGEMSVSVLGRVRRHLSSPLLLVAR